MHTSWALLGLLAPIVAAVPPMLPPYPTCNKDSAIKRKEWSAQSTEERQAYVSGIQCLMNKPSLYVEGMIPASTSHYLDFTATHVQEALSVHISGTFLSWHREFLHIMETALHEHCGYPEKLGLPYWDWPKYTSNALQTSSLFDGSPDSLGTNGETIEGRPPIEIPFWENVTIPAGTGGGCVRLGPFSNATITFGPYPLSYVQTGLPANWSEPNPRCLTRDLNSDLLNRMSNQREVTKLLAATNITDFQWRMTPNAPAIHGGGHASVGGELADFFGSPQDPTFFVHHSMIDRLWTMWQQRGNGQARRQQYNGTSSAFYAPDTPEVTGDTIISFGPLGEEITLDEAKDPMSGRYCYMYE